MALNPIGMTAEKLRNLKPAPPPAPLRKGSIGMTLEAPEATMAMFTELLNKFALLPTLPLKKDSVEEQLVETQRFTFNFNPSIVDFWKEKEAILSKYRIYENNATARVFNNNDVTTYLYKNENATRMITFKTQDRKLEVCVKDIQDGKAIIVGCL